MNPSDCDLQKRIISVRMTHILNNKVKAESWMKSPQFSLGGSTPNKCIEEGHYEWVLRETEKLATGCY
jgi:hypothetical protein